MYITQKEARKRIAKWLHNKGIRATRYRFVDRVVNKGKWKGWRLRVFTTQGTMSVSIGEDGYINGSFD